MAGIRLRVESRRREKASSAVLEILLIASRSSVREKTSMPEEARDGISRWLVPVEAVLIALRFGK